MALSAARSHSKDTHVHDSIQQDINYAWSKLLAVSGSCKRQNTSKCMTRHMNDACKAPITAIVRLQWLGSLRTHAYQHVNSFSEEHSIHTASPTSSWQACLFTLMSTSLRTIQCRPACHVSLAAAAELRHRERAGSLRYKAPKLWTTHDTPCHACCGHAHPDGVQGVRGMTRRQLTAPPDCSESTTFTSETSPVHGSGPAGI